MRSSLFMLFPEMAICFTNVAPFFGDRLGDIGRACSFTGRYVFYCTLYMYMYMYIVPAFTDLSLNTTEQICLQFYL